MSSDVKGDAYEGLLEKNAEVVMELFPFRHQQYKVESEFGADEGYVATGPFSRLSSQQPGIEPRTARQIAHSDTGMKFYGSRTEWNVTQRSQHLNPSFDLISCNPKLR
jgi:hypothetical protein